MSNPKQLSEREIEVALVASHGYSIKYIAYLLSISTRTVECHIRNINQKLGIKKRDELIKMQMDNKLLAQGIQRADFRTRLGYARLNRVSAADCMEVNRHSRLYARGIRDGQSKNELYVHLLLCAEYLATCANPHEAGTIIFWWNEGVRDYQPDRWHEFFEKELTDLAKELV